MLRSSDQNPPWPVHVLLGDRHQGTDGPSSSRSLVVLSPAETMRPASSATRMLLAARRPIAPRGRGTSSRVAGLRFQTASRSGTSGKAGPAVPRPGTAPSTPAPPRGSRRRAPPRGRSGPRRRHGSRRRRSVHAALADGRRANHWRAGPSCSPEDYRSTRCVETVNPRTSSPTTGLGVATVAVGQPGAPPPGGFWKGLLVASTIGTAVGVLAAALQDPSFPPSTIL